MFRAFMVYSERSAMLAGIRCQVNYVLVNKKKNKAAESLEFSRPSGFLLDFGLHLTEKCAVAM